MVKTPTVEPEVNEPTEDMVQDVVDVGGELVDKGDLEGHVLTVSSWKENQSRFTRSGPAGVEQTTGTYLVFAAKDVCNPANKRCQDGDFSFAGGIVLDRQAREMNGPFRGRLSMPKGKRYWVFRAPSETREDEA